VVVAHGLGQIRDLPIPGFFFLYGGGAILLLSFAALGALWLDPVLERERDVALPTGFQHVLLSRVLRGVLRGATLALAVLVVVAAFDGTRDDDMNLAPLAVWVILWLALVPVTLLLGNVWSAVSPLRALGPLARRPRLPYPERLGRWPAAVLLFAFVALELVYPKPSDPRTLGAAMLVYATVTLGGMVVFSADAWLPNGEAFEVYFGFFARLAPFAVREGRIVVRPPLVGVARFRAGPGDIAFVSVMLGGVVFDSITRTSWWLGVRRGALAADLARIPVELAFLAATVAAVAGAYLAAVAFAERLSGERGQPLAPLFLGSLIPIALAYSIAHYFTLLIGQGRLIVPLASDPLNRGWNLFGGAGYTPNLRPLSTHAVWYVQVAALVTGHVVGLVLAHDRSVSLYEGGAAIRSQYAMLGLMVLLTVGGLFLLSRP
jgi:hypothetical protein